MIDCMLDIETLGRGPGCVVTSVAITPFHINGKALEPTKVFRMKLDIADQLIAGFTIEPETHKWWMQQDPKVREMEFNGIYNIDKFCIDLEAYIRMIERQYTTYRIWATAPKLDFGCLHSLCVHAGVKWPILFSSERCMRTFREMTKTLYPSFKLPSGSANHCAADDTTLQIKQIQACYARLGENSEIKKIATTGASEEIHGDVRTPVSLRTVHSSEGNNRSTSSLKCGGTKGVPGCSIRGGYSGSSRRTNGSLVRTSGGLYRPRTGTFASATVRRGTKK